MRTPCRRAGAGRTAPLPGLVDDAANLGDTFSALRTAVKATEQAADGGHAAIGYLVDFFLRKSVAVAQVHGRRR